MNTSNLNENQYEVLNAKEARQFRPTLYIALGGAGKEVLLRLRRRILQTLWNGRRISSFENFPVVDFMYFDTYTGKAEEQYAAGKEGEAEDPLRHLTELSSADCIQKKLDVAKYLQGREIERYPHIQKWLPRGELLAIRAEDGAGQVRPISRLLFFDEVNRIWNLINAKARRLLHNVGNDHLDRLGLEISSEVEIVVVCSLAGGTGSGSFIDTGYLCKSLQNPRPARVQLFAITGGAFAGLNERVLANTYAAMMELEYCMKPSSLPYVDSWSDNERSRAMHPYDTMFFIDSKNLGLQSTGSRDFLFNMIADMLFEDIHDAALRGKRREDAVNQEQFKVQPFHPPMPKHVGAQAIAYSRAYSSAGQVTLDTSARMDFERQTTQVAADMLEAFFRIAGDNTQNTPRPSDVDAFLKNLLYLDGGQFYDRFPNYIRKDKPSIIDYPLIDRLLRHDNLDLTQRAREAVRNAMEDIPSTQPDMRMWPARVTEVSQQQLKTVIADVRSGSRNPPLIQALNSERAKLLSELSTPDGGLRKELYLYLDNQERGGLAFTTQLIQEIRDRLGTISARLTSAQNDYQGLAKRIYNDHYQTAHNNLQRAVKGGFFGRADEKQVALFMQQTGDTLAHHIEYILRAQVCEEARGLLGDVVETLGQGSALGEGTETGATGILNEFEQGRAVIRALLQSLSSQIRLLDDATQSKNPFRRFIGGGALPDLSLEVEKFGEWGRQALGESGGSRVLFQQLRDENHRAIIANTLRGIARERLKDHETKLQPVQMVLEKLSDTERRKLFKDSLYAALPWVNADFERTKPGFDPKMLTIFVVVENADDFRRAFNEEIMASLPSQYQNKDIYYVASDLRGRVVFYTEMTGIALNSLVSLHDDWRTAYNKRSHGSQKLPLHNHKDMDRFAHPTAMTLDELEQLHDTLQLFFLGLALGHLRRREDGRYAIDAGAGHVADWQSIGSERQLYLNGFLESQGMLLRDKNETKVQDLTDLQRLLVSVLLDWIGHHAYAPRKEVLAGGQEQRSKGIAHFAAIHASEEFHNRFLSREFYQQLGLSKDQAFKQLTDTVTQWSTEIPDSIKDTTPLEANMDERDPEALRAKNKRVINWSAVTDNAIHQWLGLAAPATESGTDQVPPPLPGADMEYFIAENNQYTGPFPLSGLLDLMKQGRLTEDTLVWRDGMPSWEPAKEVDDLSQLFRKRQPPPLPS